MLHELKGKVTGAAGRLTNKPDLEANGTDERLAGNVQGKIGPVEKVLGKSACRGAGYSPDRWNGGRRIKAGRWGLPVRGRVQPYAWSPGWDRMHCGRR
jgi:uncharacterized protein YjbJ (UPF0337 family)